MPYLLIILIGGSSYPAITIPFVLLLLVFAARVFHGIITTGSGHNGCLVVIFTFVATIIPTVLVGLIGGIPLFLLNAYSPEWAWLALTAFSLICVVIHIYNKRKKERKREAAQREHEAWEARHRNDLCRYCDAYRIGESVHHSPACPRG